METKAVTCKISGRLMDPAFVCKGNSIRAALLEVIQAEHSDFGPDDFISLDILNSYRKKHLQFVISKEIGEVTQLEKGVLENIEKNDNLVARYTENDLDERNLSQRLADKIASFGGSWTFIIFFFLFILLWMAVNIWMLTQPFDAFPFILLNLILSCLAAIQAPIIMMSQNRQEEKDRLRAIQDYRINLKAEMEIRLLHEKIDHLIIHQNQRLIEIQEIQADYMEDILKVVSQKK
jgi:uncharacterized membrane protein